MSSGWVGGRGRPSPTPAGERPDGLPSLEISQIQRFFQSFEFSPDCQLVTDGLGVILESNQAASSLFDRSKEFLVGKPLGLLMARGWRSRFYESLSAFKGGRSTVEFETRITRSGRRAILARGVLMVPAEDGRGAAVRWQLQDVTDRREDQMIRASLLRRLVTAQEDERRRVARELHDSVGQLLSALLLSVRAARDCEPMPAAATRHLDDVQMLAHELGRATHSLAVELRPTLLDDFGLLSALESHVARWSERSKVEAHFHAVGLEGGRLTADVESAIYRLVQEALTNVVKHAEASLVSIVVERHDGYLIVVVEDNGIGFDTDVPRGDRLGLTGMDDRVTLLGGRLQVESTPGQGTMVHARIPLGSVPSPAD